MSYLIHIWESPVPASVAEAIRFLDTSGHEQVGQNPKFISLANALMAAYPCITTLADNDATGVWSDGPLDGVTDERCYVLGISQHHSEVRQHLVACASRLGLTCFDMQDGRLFLPDGSVLPEGIPLSATRPVRLTEEDLSLELQRIVRPYGFSAGGQSGNIASRAVDGCTQTIWLLHVNRYGQFEFSLRLLVKWEQHPIALQLVPQFLHDGPGSFLAWDTADATTAMAQLAVFIERLIVPFLDRCTSLEGVDSVLNQPQRSFHGVEGDWIGAWLGALYAAHKVGNPHFEDLVAACSVRARGHFRNYAWLATQRWVALLREKSTSELPPVAALYADTQQELKQFIQAYDGTRRGEIAFASNGRAGVGAEDRNLGYRRALAASVLMELESAPLPLLADLLVAEAEWARGQLLVDRCVGPLTHTLFARAGVECLDSIRRALECGANVLEAIKTIDVPPPQAAALGAACRQRGAAERTSKMTLRWSDLANFFEQVCTQQPPDDIAAFAAAYTSARSHRIGFRWGPQQPAGQARLPGKDLNKAFRALVRTHALKHPDAVPMALICDLFIAESKAANSMGALLDYGPRTPDVMLLAQAMLHRGGARELQLFETVLEDGLDLRWPYDRMVLPRAKGTALAALCHERGVLAACRERRHAYRQLALFFDHVPSEVSTDHLRNHAWRPAVTIC